MATEEKPASEPELSPAENLEPGEFVYRASEPERMHFRDVGDGVPVLEGVMMPYDEWTEINSSVEGHFMERFAPTSLAKTISDRATRIRALFEHGQGFLDKQPIAQIEEMRDEPDGAHFRASLLEGLPDLLLAGLRRGLYGSSIRFRPIKMDRNRSPGQSEHNPDGIEERTYKEASMMEFSVVTFPQYAGATAGIRSLTDEISVGRLLKDPERLIEVIQRATTEEPQHSEPVVPEENPEPEESRSTRPTHDYLSDEEGAPSWRL